MAPDYYAQGRALGADLWEAGYKDLADEIDDIIASGSTGSEILMALRWVMSQISVSERDLPPEMRDRASMIFTEIDSALS